MGKKKILLIIIPIILLIMIGAGIFAFLYLATDMFKSDKELFMKSISQSYEIMDVFENENVKEQNDFKLTNTYTSSGNLNLSITENGDTKNINLTTASRRDNNTGRKYSEVALKNGTNDLLKASYVNSGDVYAIKCDDILGLYMGFKDSGFKEYAQKLGLSEDDIKKIPDSINFEGIYQLSDLTDEQKKYIIETYSKVIFDSIPEDKFSKLNGSQITVGDKTYSANAYTLNLSGSEIKQIIINCLTALQQDNTSLVIM